MIRIENLTHIYSKGTPFEKVAIDNISLQIDTGEIVGIIGHTGSGKSTLIQHLNGLLKPTEGNVYINDVDIFESKQTTHKIRFDIGLVFQYPEYQLFEETVYKDIAFGPKNLGFDEAKIKQSVLSACESVGISEDLLEKSPFDLSGGQKRRVAIAGVIAMNPSILILDEPTAGLDPSGHDKILNMIKSYHEKQKKTVLIVSHSMEDIAKYTNKVLVMNNSKVFKYGTVDEIFMDNTKIENIGLDIPQISKLFSVLSKKFGGIRKNVYDINIAKDILLELLSKKGGV